MEIPGNESEFRFDELFISRTDKRGILLFVNPVFRRVAKLEWQQMLGKPHRVVRHPAMPRGVFQLFWDVILDDRSVGSYVVNRSSDGGYYWVYALVSPIKSGFLSVRLKPSSPMFEAARKLYVDVLEAEKSRKLSPLEGKAYLLQRIREMGYRDYPHFMAEALAEELGARQKKIGREPHAVMVQLREILGLGNRLQQECAAISAAYARSAFVPLNLEVQAARIGREAAPIAVISAQYGAIARQIQEDIKTFAAAGVNVHERISACLFDVCNAILQQEMAEFFATEEDTPNNRDEEILFINESMQDNLAKAGTSLLAVEREFSRFRAVYDEVRKQAMALDVISVTGKIEAVKIRQSPELMGLLDDLGVFKETLKDSLKRINEIGNGLVGKINVARSAAVLQGGSHQPEVLSQVS